MNVDFFMFRCHYVLCIYHINAYIQIYVDAFTLI